MLAASHPAAGGTLERVTVHADQPQALAVRVERVGVQADVDDADQRRQRVGRGVARYGLIVTSAPYGCVGSHGTLLSWSVSGNERPLTVK